MRLPTVLNIEGPVIVLGGGEVGMRKVDYLRAFGADLTVVDEKDIALPEGVDLVRRKIALDNLPDLIPEGTVLVVAALSSRELNHGIAGHCRALGIMVNVVDDPEVSTILFPAMSRSGDVNIAISTSGRCPFLARKIREELDGSVDEMAIWLEVLSPVRERLAGIDEKNRVLALVYSDEETAQLVRSGDLEGAKTRAWEVYDVHSQS